MYVCLYVCMYVCTRMGMCICVGIGQTPKTPTVPLPWEPQNSSPRTPSTGVSLHSCVYAYLYVCLYVCVCIYTGVYTCRHNGMYGAISTTLYVCFNGHLPSQPFSGLACPLLPFFMFICTHACMHVYNACLHVYRGMKKGRRGQASPQKRVGNQSAH